MTYPHTALRCETPAGPGTVLRVWNATRWQPAWIEVELENGRRRTFNAALVKVLR